MHARIAQYGQIVEEMKAQMELMQQEIDAATANAVPRPTCTISTQTENIYTAGYSSPQTPRDVAKYFKSVVSSAKSPPPQDYRSPSASALNADAEAFQPRARGPTLNAAAQPFRPRLCNVPRPESIGDTSSNDVRKVILRYEPRTSFGNPAWITIQFEGGSTYPKFVEVVGLRQRDSNSTSPLRISNGNSPRMMPVSEFWELKDTKDATDKDKIPLICDRSIFTNTSDESENEVNNAISRPPIALDENIDPSLLPTQHTLNLDAMYPSDPSSYNVSLKSWFPSHIFFLLTYTQYVNKWNVILYSC